MIYEIETNNQLYWEGSMINLACQNKLCYSSRIVYYIGEISLDRGYKQVITFCNCCEGFSTHILDVDTFNKIKGEMK